ncbi:unnamed protein product [Phyllotreta striolata]|uniref:TLC domain-containing protein n=1 Tax=Phyllotreta striolata TaxID=444603 RepID=A0A9N9XRU1_PHYSR|nr:unnamed protein product [Phyllotreta striolata]
MKNLIKEFIASNIFYTMPCVFFLLIVRNALEKYCFQRIAICCGLTHKNNKIYRFNRSCWHLFYYLMAVMHTAIVLHDKPWMKDDAHFWTFHEHRMTTDVWFLVVLNLSYFFSLIIKLLTTKIRKDFAENMVHHIIAILLIFQAIFMNLYHVASFTILILFPSDIFLELAKILIYLKYDIPSKVCFVLFSIVWVIMRLILYPMWIVYPSMLYSYEIVGPILYYINVIVFGSLMVLYLFWTYKIYLMDKRLIFEKILEDYRSDDDDYDAKFNKNR